VEGGGGPRRKRHKTSSKIIENLDAEHLEMQDHVQPEVFHS
jgi:hypothetical protein